MNDASERKRTAKLLITDIWGSQVIPSLHTLSSLTEENLLERFPLALPSGSTEKRESLSVSAFSKFTKLLTNAGEFIAILGCNEDPFFPFEGKFEASLKALELIALAKPKRIIIQTRSPLAVLALPLIKSLGERVVVRIAFEAASDAIQSTHFPELPRISERMKFARALIALGVRTELQLSPIVGQSDRASVFSTFVKEINAPLHLVSLSELLRVGQVDELRSPTAQLIQRSDRYLERIARAFPERIRSSRGGITPEVLAA